MKKQLELTVTRTEKVKVEVEFPIYSKNEDSGDHSSWSTYYRLSANGQYVCVRINEGYRGDVEYEITSTPRTELSSGSDYDLGKGEHACTPEEFNSALEKAIQFAQSLQVVPE